MTKPSKYTREGRVYRDDLPDWAIGQGITAARHLDGDEWLVLRPMIFHVQLAVCTPAPDGGILEFWDYEEGAMGALDAVHAFTMWPERDFRTEMWVRHRDNLNQTERRHVRIEDKIPTTGDQNADT